MGRDKVASCLGVVHGSEHFSTDAFELSAASQKKLIEPMRMNMEVFIDRLDEFANAHEIRNQQSECVFVLIALLNPRIASREMLPG